MHTNRRQFIARSAIGGLGLVAAPLLPASSALAGTASPSAARPPIAASLARCYRFSPADGTRTEDLAWIQIDLGVARPIDAIRFRPSKTGLVAGHHTPAHFCIDCSDDPAFGETQPLVDWRAGHASDPLNLLAHFPRQAMNARYIRVSASAHSFLGAAQFPFGLTSIEILSGGITIPIAVQPGHVSPRRGWTARAL